MLELSKRKYNPRHGADHFETRLEAASLHSPGIPPTASESAFWSVASLL